MFVRFSISTKVKTFPFSMALVLSVVCAVLNNIQNASIIFGFDVSPYKGLIISVSTFFIGLFLALTLSFITPRVDKKLLILNKEYFLPLLKLFYSVYRPEWYIAEIEKGKEIKEDLVKYGRYFRIPCYPRKLIKEIDEFFKHAEEHNKLIGKLQELSRQKIGKDSLTILFGLLNLADVNLKNYNPNTVKIYEPVSNYIKQEKTELLEEIKASNKQITEKHDSIIQRFESFLKDNSLEMGETKSETNELISVLIK